MTIHTPLAQQIAAAIGKPENEAFIERQLLAKSFAANRAAIDRSLAYDRARLSAVSLDRDEQIALAIHIIDHLNGCCDDARNAAVDAMGELL